MTSRQAARQVALAHLGLADDAGRTEVIRAYRRLARATHPDLSDAPDAAAQFAALTAAYHRALTPADAEATEWPEPSTGTSVRLTVHVAPAHEHRVSAPVATRDGSATLIGDAFLVTPPIVAGPAFIEPTPTRRGTRIRVRRGP